VKSFSRLERDEVFARTFRERNIETRLIDEKDEVIEKGSRNDGSKRIFATTSTC